ncbi:helix-turn-helix transcriptional regulator [Yinghuangia sp. ASG 101]|uniref:winged helix-turn-helix transcriptional regulator n=1 Tax=Yinghuangia sp. ASG 101 TaxID=2896848 RepID=UPI001E33D63F|nr:helix-turn-helix domain-containing protein [Yinghuangia sp. ASG 101]UGQ11635.1 helix-turn-helix transcriptional regulator [Yinghuangia sp. ASG 101]
MSRRNIRVTEPTEVTQACQVLDVLNRVSGKWSISVLMEVHHAPVRFTELERAIHGISRRMLTLTLRSLERDGLLTRTVYPTVPPKVEYEATAMARELYEYLAGLTAWAERHEPAMRASRQAYDLGVD